jgi:serine/threonine protein kinase
VKEADIEAEGDRVRDMVEGALNEREIHWTLIEDSEKNNISMDEYYYRAHLCLIKTVLQRRNSHFLIFPWAENGDLLHLWKTQKIKDYPDIALAWMQTNITGLIGALCFLHKLNCSHGDLKPDNIFVGNPWNSPFLGPDIWRDRELEQEELFERCERLKRFETLGLLQIADLGVAKMHREGLDHSDTNQFLGYSRYAPKGFHRLGPGEIAPQRTWRYDIWSMGCIFLEFITWICEEQEGVDNFNVKLGLPDDRVYWGEDGGPHKEVLDHYHYLEEQIKKQDPKCTGYLLSLLRTVKENMLVVDNDRATAENILYAMIRYSPEDLNTSSFQLKNRQKTLYVRY